MRRRESVLPSGDNRATVTFSWESGLPTLVLCKQQGISAFLASPPVSDDLVFFFFFLERFLSPIYFLFLFLVVKNKAMESTEEEVFVQILKIFQSFVEYC